MNVLTMRSPLSCSAIKMVARVEKEFDCSLIRIFYKFSPHLKGLYKIQNVLANVLAYVLAHAYACVHVCARAYMHGLNTSEEKVKCAINIKSINCFCARAKSIINIV